MNFVELLCTTTASEFSARKTSMPHSIEFIHSRPTPGLDNRDRKRIRRHVLEARSKRQDVPQKSWLNPDLLRLPDVGPMSGLTSPSQTIARSLASSQLSVIQSQYEVTPRMLRDLHNFSISRRAGLSPFEACAQVEHTDDELLANVMSDQLMLNLSILQARTYFGQKFELDPPGPGSYQLLGKVLQLLQRRLDDHKAAVSDTTLLVVSSLIMLEHDAGHAEVAKKHMAGLHEMVALRGGIKALTHNHCRMQRKVCRVDLSVALKFASRPLLFREDMVWSSFMTKSNLIRRRRKPIMEPSSLDNILSELNIDDKLKHILEDLREFSLLAELAYQTTGTLDPSLVNEAMISIMYRLLHLSFIKNTVEDMLRLGLLIYSTHIFLPGQTFVGRYRHLVDDLHDAFDDPKMPLDQIPVDVQLWLAVMAAMLYRPAVQDQVVAGVMSNASEALRLRSWSDTRGVLKSVLWIGFMHDQPGRIITNTLIDFAIRTK